MPPSRRSVGLRRNCSVTGRSRSLIRSILVSPTCRHWLR
ncbi:MAG: hypothetical protein IH587_06010 [Anaerolineae bacterium]|nr:hypothetical protein [Anaerolineae bacterium]